MSDLSIDPEVYVPPGRRADKRHSPLEPSDVDYEDFGDSRLYVSLWFDPGGTTGWSLFAVFMEALRLDTYPILGNVAFWSAGELKGSETEQADAMIAMARQWPDAHLGIEDFIPDIRVMKGGKEAMSPVRITAKFDYGCHLVLNDRRYITQVPALAMTTITDERLRMFGFWNPTTGQPHARDAIRHNLTWLRRAKEIMTIRTSDAPGGLS